MGVFWVMKKYGLFVNLSLWVRVIWLVLLVRGFVSLFFSFMIWGRNMKFFLIKFFDYKNCICY